jgi:ferredoxin
LTVCPTGAFQADDAVQDLLICATRLESKKIELVCALHPDPEVGVSEETEAIQVKGCLAGLGTGVYLALAALHLQEVYVRTDACEDCPWGKLKDRISSQVEDANNIVKKFNDGQSLKTVNSLDSNRGVQRPFWKAENPPLSRRDLFRMAAQRSQMVAARALSAGHSDHAGRRPGRERRRINEALQRMEAAQAAPDLGMGDFGYATLNVSEACTACGVCSRACPTGALFYTQTSGSSFKLAFDPLNCIGCDICAQVCAPQAIDVNHHPEAQSVFLQESPAILYEGALTHCERCNDLFASSAGSKLCPVCQARRQNPFGSQLPPSLKHLQSLIDQRKNS